jgi:glycerophosphoryl diester phosphodiesterase
MVAAMPPTSLLTERLRPLVIAHRGVPVQAPENTLASFRLALEAGADAIETDLRLTRDGAIVCLHDATLDRTTDRTGPASEMTLAEIRTAVVIASEHGQFAADQPVGGVPTLEEVLALLPPDVGLALELKDPGFADEQFARRLAELCAARITDGTVLLLSFDVELLRAARRAAPGVWIGAVAEWQPDPDFDGNGVSTTPQAMLANPDYMRQARERGLWVCPLDPRPDQRLPWYMELGVDAVLTDDTAATRFALLALRGSPRP